jgi:hypothetical protein
MISPKGIKKLISCTKDLSKISIEFIPHKDHKFTTIGHWFEDEFGAHIQISQELKWEFRIAVLFHELIEYSMCREEGITTKECDDFDALFEIEYEQGVWLKSVEAGFDKRCPYRKGHVWGSRFERLVIWLLGVSWVEYTEACDKLMGV